MTDGSSAPDDSGGPLHEGCLLCTLIERPALGGAALQPTAAAPLIETLRASWREPAFLPSARHASARAARAPPLA